MIATNSGDPRQAPIAIGGRAFTRKRGHTVCYARRCDVEKRDEQARIVVGEVAGILFL